MIENGEFEYYADAEGEHYIARPVFGRELHLVVKRARRFYRANWQSAGRRRTGWWVLNHKSDKDYKVSRSYEAASDFAFKMARQHLINYSVERNTA